MVSDKMIKGAAVAVAKYALHTDSAYLQALLRLQLATVRRPGGKSFGTFQCVICGATWMRKDNHTPLTTPHTQECEAGAVERTGFLMSIGLTAQMVTSG